jgi:hypothetical protein
MGPAYPAAAPQYIGPSVVYQGVIFQHNTAATISATTTNPFPFQAGECAYQIGTGDWCTVIYDAAYNSLAAGVVQINNLIGQYDQKGNPAGGASTGSTDTAVGYSPPAETTDTATGTLYNAVTVNATVNPNGLATTYYFQYGLTAAYGLTTGTQSAGSSTSEVPVSAAITGLTPSTTYYYQLVAASSSGTTYGANQTFTTTQALNPAAFNMQIAGSGSGMRVSIQSVAGYSYQLQRAGSLSGTANWQNIGGAQAGVNGALTFVDNSGGLFNAAFYRVQISQ